MLLRRSALLSFLQSSLFLSPSYTLSAFCVLSLFLWFFSLSLLFLTFHTSCVILSITLLHFHLSLSTVSELCTVCLFIFFCDFKAFHNLQKCILNYLRGYPTSGNMVFCCKRIDYFLICALCYSTGNSSVKMALKSTWFLIFISTHF